MPESTQAPVALESILCTDELYLRPAKPPDYQKENQALVALMLALVNSPQGILQVLAESILQVLNCGSAGVSVLSTNDGGARFYWPAIAGSWKPHIGGGTPRNFGPCGDVLDRNTPLLFKNIERRYTYFLPVTPLVEEALLVPFYVAKKAVGTVWAIAHNDYKFDAEDKRQLESLARFASAAYQAVASLDASSQLAAIVGSSDDAIVSKNLDGIINSWNTGAEHLFGYTAAEAIGKHIFLIVPPDRREEEITILERLSRGIRVDHFETVRMRKDGTRLDISLTISPVKDAAGRVIGASKVARDITERNRIEGVRKEAEVSTRLLQVQDAERRRISRELHDGVGQLLAAISMNASQIKREKSKLSQAAARCVDENSDLIEQVLTEIRTMSYLLHPPMLEELGLHSALRWYIDGFAERGKIAVTLELASDLGRLPEDYELSLFRVAQECLTNIHRHSGASAALVRLSHTPNEITLEVKDDGKGIGEQMQSNIASGGSTGVGFRGMRERVKLIGGTLTVQSGPNGTSVLVALPVTWEIGSLDATPDP
jgi:PAS domain S-box-containing protein